MSHHGAAVAIRAPRVEEVNSKPNMSRLEVPRAAA